MTPAARLAAAGAVIDSITQSRQPAEAVLKAWGAANRYAGSKDRRAIADRVYKVLRARGRLSWIMGGREDGRALVIGSLSAIDGLSLEEIEALHSGEGYGPRPLSKQERNRLTAQPGDLPGWIAAGLPEFVVEDFKATFGDRWAEEAQGLMVPRAPIDLRVNTARASVEAVEAELREAGLDPAHTPLSPVGLRLAAEPPPNVQALDAFQAGRIEIQDEGSQVVCALAGAKPGMTVVDYCAGGGGKTLGLAAAMDLAQGEEAGIDRAAGTVGFLDHHGAGAAIAFGAAFLGAGQRGGAAQPVEQGGGGRELRRQVPRLVVQVEGDMGRHGSEPSKADAGIAMAGIAGRGRGRRRRAGGGPCHGTDTRRAAVPGLVRAA